MCAKFTIPWDTCLPPGPEVQRHWTANTLTRKKEKQIKKYKPRRSNEKRKNCKSPWKKVSLPESRHHCAGSLLATHAWIIVIHSFTRVSVVSASVCNFRLKTRAATNPTATADNKITLLHSMSLWRHSFPVPCTQTSELEYQWHCSLQRPAFQEESQRTQNYPPPGKTNTNWNCPCG